MFTYGFYNSLNGDRKYDATQISSIFDGIIQDGVYSNIGEFFAVVPGEGDGLNVLVKTGRAWFNHTWSLNDAYLPLMLDGSDPLLKRIDAVVLEVDTRIEKRENSIKIVKGTLSLTPAKPTLTNDGGVFQHLLAYVTVNEGATSISASDIEIIVGKDETPFVQCPLKTVSISDLFQQWDSEFTTWFDNVKAQLSGNVATNLQNQINTLEETKATRQELRHVDNKYKVPKYQIFRLSGTFTVPSTAIDNEFTIVCQGGGGGGCLGGGGGGYTVIKKATLTPGSEIPVTVGAGGAPGGITGNPKAVMHGGAVGGTGGSTIFGDVATAEGGSGGDSHGNGGSGGSGGGAGGTMYNLTKTENNGYVGNGGNGGYYGGGGGAAGTGKGGLAKVENYPNGFNGGNGGYYGGGGASGYAYTTNSDGDALPEIDPDRMRPGGHGGEFGGDAGQNGPWHDTIKYVMDKFFIKKPIANQSIGGHDGGGGGGYSGFGAVGRLFDTDDIYDNYSACGGGGGYAGNGGYGGPYGGGGGGGITGDGGGGSYRIEFFAGGGGGGLDIGDGYKADDAVRTGKSNVSYVMWYPRGGFGYGAGGAGSMNAGDAHPGCYGSNGICIVYWYEVDDYT